MRRGVRAASPLAEPSLRRRRKCVNTLTVVLHAKPKVAEAHANADLVGAGIKGVEEHCGGGDLVGLERV